MSQYYTLLPILLLISITSCSTYGRSDYQNFIEADVRFFKYEELDIKYTDIGVGNTILFIHGLGSSSFTWRHLYKYYSLDYRVISLDLKGFGDSSKPINRKYTVSDQAKIIHRFIENMDLSDVTLVGNSYGGAVVLSTFLTGDLDLKRRVSHLILLDPAAYNQKKYPGYVTLLRTPFFNRVALGLGSKNFIARVVLKQIFYNDSLITHEMVSTYGGYLRGASSHNALIETAKSISSAETERLSVRYSQIDIPVLIIWGEYDNVISKAMGEQLNRDIPNSELMILNNCGHVPQEELPLDTIDAINKWL